MKSEKSLKKSLKPLETGGEGELKRRLSISVKSEVKEKDEENPRRSFLLLMAVRKIVKKILNSEGKFL